MDKKNKTAEDESGAKKLAIVRVRGVTGLRHGIELTLKNLRLYRKNFCVVVPGTKGYIGMINKIKDYATWGEIDDETYNMLIEKRKEEYKGEEDGEKDGNKFIIVDGVKIKKVFRLNSPRKGYGRKGVKTSCKDGGALGYRGDKINDLIKRMI